MSLSEIPVVGTRLNDQPYKGSRGSHHVGMVGEGRFIAWAAEQGWHLYRGLDGHTPCDFVVDTGSEMLRVEVKRCETPLRSQDNYYYHTLTKMDSAQFDYLFVSTPHGDYWIPSSSCGRTAVSIKVVGEEADYVRNITRPGKYHPYKIGE